MSIHFEKIKVKQVRKETPECISVSFDIPEELKKDFFYKQGQHLTLRTFIDGLEIRRSYSLCSSPLENEWRVAIKQTDGGRFSSFANNNLKQGDILEIMPPMGNFYTEIDPAHQKNYVAIVAGSGITPAISIIKTVLAKEPKSTFTLIYGNRTRGSIIFKDELEALKNKYMQRFNLMHILSRELTDSPINHGRIDAEKCKEIFNSKIAPSNGDDFFLCGPEAMIFGLKDFLEKSGVNPKNIHFELFVNPGQEAAKNHQKTATKSIATPKSKITAKLDGIVFEYEADFENENILDAGLKEGIDLPYSCKGGVCCTCKAKLLEGEVKMDVHYGLEDEEVEDGFILTCQSHPVTNKVVVDFDIK